MDPAKPRRTATGAAKHRTVHHALEHGMIAADPPADRILGADPDGAVRDGVNNPATRALRLFIAVRTRLADDAVLGVVEGGVRRLVVLEAGLDTVAYRTEFAASLNSFDADHPATQIWKRQRLADAAIPIPGPPKFPPVDLERENVGEALAAAGFDRAKPTLFTWPGAVPYLSEQAGVARASDWSGARAVHGVTESAQFGDMRL